MSLAGSSQISRAGSRVASIERSFYGEDQENPFKIPSDEIVFTFKESEKDRKLIERERNK